MVDLIEQSRLAVDELIDVAGRATIETVLQLSAEQLAGPRTPGAGGPAFRWQTAPWVPILRGFSRRVGRSLIALWDSPFTLRGNCRAALGLGGRMRPPLRDL